MLLRIPNRFLRSEFRHGISDFGLRLFVHSDMRGCFEYALALNSLLSASQTTLHGRKSNELTEICLGCFSAFSRTSLSAFLSPSTSLLYPLTHFYQLCFTFSFSLYVSLSSLPFYLPMTYFYSFTLHSSSASCEIPRALCCPTALQWSSCPRGRGTGTI